MENPKNTSTGAGFFHIDRRTWKVLCGLEAINMVAAYLTIAAGTGKGNRRSKWSAVAIQNYTGLAWKRGKPAIAELIATGFISLAESSTIRGPVYELQPFDVVLEAARSRMSGREQYILTAVRERDVRLTKSQREGAEALVMRGLLWQDGGVFSAEPPKLDAAADLIWLPNALVTGTAKGESSPVKRLRQCRNLDALRLLVDLYYAQHLAADGGISRKVSRPPIAGSAGATADGITFGVSSGERRPYIRPGLPIFFGNVKGSRRTATMRSGTRWRH